MITDPTLRNELKTESKSKLQLEVIVEESIDAIIGESLEGIILSWNGGAEKMFGYLSEEAIGKQVSFLFPPELKNEAQTLLGKVKKSEVVADYDSVRIRKDGSKINVALSVSPIHSETGEIIGASVVERDITKRKVFEARIQRMSQLYAALSKCNKAVVHSRDENELFQQICNAAVQFGGMTMAWVGLVDEASKQVKPVASFGTGTEYLNGIQISIKAEDPSGHWPTGVSARENRPVWIQDFKNDPMTVLWHKRANDVGWLSSAALPLLQNNIPIGSLTLYSNVMNAFDDDAQRLLVEMAADISFGLDNFMAKAKQKKTEEALIESAANLKKAQEISKIGNWKFDLTTGKIDWSDEIYVLYERDKKLGPPTQQEEAAYYTPEIAKHLSGLGRSVTETKKQAFFEFPVKLPSGKEAFFNTRISPLIESNGKVIQLIGVVQDISERKKSEQHIKELNEVRNKFIEIISHQLRTPLGVVNWNLEMLLKGNFGRLEATQEKFLQATYAASRKTTFRIHDLLTAMDVEEGRVSLEKEEVVIDSILASIINEKKKECELKKIFCTYVPQADKLPAIQGDADKIRLIITKLIENAVYYTKEGGKINAKLFTKDDIIRFEVTDTGIGIPEPEQHRVFERFFRASNASVMLTDAFGLGLYLAKHFIDQHGGRIGFTSKEGVGSTFWFELPVKLV